ncbi:hypothetical protein [Bradyrhizobium sp. NP1]|uniref:hypothetical protein n=1 Tax=Bradyrhizobium sp. NP1 TaxID=3049772 RepID=UPI0025A5E8EC|nr:hypothetical protein [Bradyrhizobium sp. NP1]WJR81156.1 hypothetical protein QOU61_15785 [Bradyrhizobium sp. NP1]
MEQKDHETLVSVALGRVLVRYGIIRKEHLCDELDMMSREAASTRSDDTQALADACSRGKADIQRWPEPKIFRRGI